MTEPQPRMGKPKPGQPEPKPADTRLSAAAPGINPRRRGRPKGTGIDDQSVLISIQALMASDRAMKPTTAIKRRGITDPSMIRRLRDKLRSPEPAITRPLTTSVAAKIVTDAEPLVRNPPVQTPQPRKPVIRPATQAPQRDIIATTTTPQASPQPAPQPTSKPEPNAAQRETALLAAYLQAMLQQQTTGPTLTVGRPDEVPLPSPPAKPTPPATEMPQAMPTPPQPLPLPPPSQIANPMAGFTMPGMPNFLQPFLPKPDAAAPQTPSATRQMEAMKLAVEATTAIAKLQLHVTENAAAYSPMAMMLQGQSFMGQLMIASLTGQLATLQKHLLNPDKK
jgi:hypothetical protein